MTAFECRSSLRLISVTKPLFRCVSCQSVSPPPFLFHCTHCISPHPPHSPLTMSAAADGVISAQQKRAELQKEVTTHTHTQPITRIARMIEGTAFLANHRLTSASPCPVRFLSLPLQLTTLRIAQAELGSIKPGKSVYEQHTNGLFFLSTPGVATEHVKSKIKKIEKDITLIDANQSMKE